MLKVKIDNSILIVKLKKDNEIKICKGSPTNLCEAEDVLSGTKYNLLSDVEKYISITYIKCLEKFFDKKLNRKEMEELNKLMQSSSFKKSFSATCAGIEKSVNKLSDIISKDDDSLYSI